MERRWELKSYVSRGLCGDRHQDTLLGLGFEAWRLGSMKSVSRCDFDVPGGVRRLGGV